MINWIFFVPDKSINILSFVVQLRYSCHLLYNLDIMIVFCCLFCHSSPGVGSLPVDHMVGLLEGLTTLCHYCLLDNVAPVSVGLQTPTPSTVTMETSSAGQILNNLINVFNPSTNSRVKREREIPNYYN